MQCYLRFLCYTDPSRQVTTQIHADIAVDEPPKFSYGQPVRVGPDEQDPDTWGWYYVAYVTRFSQIEDPAKEGANALLFEVFLATEQQWPQFEFPEELIRAVKAEDL